MNRVSTILFSLALMAMFAAGAAAKDVKKGDFTGSIKAGKNDEAALSDLAKISLVSAIDAALKQVPGQALRAELENENGFLVYGVEIVSADRQVMEVKVDAGNGAILKTAADAKDSEKKGEKQDEDHEGQGKED